MRTTSLSRALFTGAILSACGGTPAPPRPIIQSEFLLGSTNIAPASGVRVIVESGASQFTVTQQVAVQSALRLVRWPSQEPVGIRLTEVPVDMSYNGLHRYFYSVNSSAELSSGWYAVVANLSAISPVAAGEFPRSLATTGGEVSFPFRVGSAPRVLRIDQCAPRSSGVRVLVTFSEQVTIGSDVGARIVVASTSGSIFSCALSTDSPVQFSLDCGGVAAAQDIEVRVGAGVCSSTGACLQQGDAPAGASFPILVSNTNEYQPGCRTFFPPLP